MCRLVENMHAFIPCANTQHLKNISECAPNPESEGSHLSKFKDLKRAMGLLLASFHITQLVTMELNIQEFNENQEAEEQ